MNITFLLLAHQQPRVVKRLIEAVVWAGHSAVVHYDKKASDTDFRFLTEAFADNPKVRFAPRVKVGWGEWSIVAATLNCIAEIEAAGWAPDYVYYASGTDFPIRPASELSAFLTRNKGKEFIEGVPADRVRWVKGGPQAERYQYRFYFNWRHQRRLSRYAYNIQRFFGLKRPFVLGMEPYIGSQWWVLTWDTIQEIMKLARRPEVLRFFRTTLIPDELFFQTLVYNTIPKSKIVARPLTLYQFTDYFVPVVFYADHLDYLLRQPFFLARKFSAHNGALHDALDACWRGEIKARPVSDAEIGIVTPEYEDIRLLRREAPPGVPIIGREANGWSGGLGWLEKPYFAIIGSSGIELRLAQMLLSRREDVLCHGQLLHARRIDFADGMTSYAGYNADALFSRNLSAPNFIADVVRAERDRMPGFLLRFGDGWHVSDVMFDRPSAKILVVHGDRLLGFMDCLANTLTVESLTPDIVRGLSPTFLALKFEQYESWLDDFIGKLGATMSTTKPKGLPPSFSWIAETTIDLELDIGRTALADRWSAKSRKLTGAAWIDATLKRWRDWLSQAEICLGLEASTSDDDVIWSHIAEELETIESMRRLLTGILAEGERTRVTRLAPRKDDMIVLSPTVSPAIAS